MGEPNFEELINLGNLCGGLEGPIRGVVSDSIFGLHVQAVSDTEKINARIESKPKYVCIYARDCLSRPVNLGEFMRKCSPPLCFDCEDYR
jgi:hypothetical protein